MSDYPDSQSNEVWKGDKLLLKTYILADKLYIERLTNAPMDTFHLTRENRIAALDFMSILGRHDAGCESIRSHLPEQLAFDILNSGWNGFMQSLQQTDEVDHFFARGGEDVLDPVRHMVYLKEKVDPANDLDGCKWHRPFETPKCGMSVEAAERP